MSRETVLRVETGSVTLRGVLGTLSQRYGKGFSDLIFDPETREIREHIRVLVNGRHFNYLPKGLDTELRDSDEVALFPPMAGG